MEPEIVKAWEGRKGVWEAFLAEKNRAWLDEQTYESLFKELAFHVLHDLVDTDHMASLRTGWYSGTFYIMIEATQRDYIENAVYWLSDYYGSCSGCDQLEDIKTMQWGDWEGPELPELRPGVLRDLMKMSLEMIQKMKVLG